MSVYDALVRRESVTAYVGATPETSSSNTTMYVALGVAALGLVLYAKVAKNPAEHRLPETAADYGG